MEMGTNIAARVSRHLRGMRNVRGWRSIAVRSAKPGPFQVRNGNIVFAGEMGSHVDRDVFLFGAYERENIDLFLASVARGGTALDIGANVGNHSLAFARHFDHVIAFEPNPELWASIDRNVALNPWASIDVRKIGLGDQSAEMPLHVTSDGHALSTFLPGELDHFTTHMVRVEAGDDLDLPPIAAIKIDVQGFEGPVLRGLRRTIERDKPAIWIEISETTLPAQSRQALTDVIPFSFDLYRFDARKGIILNQPQLVPHVGDSLIDGDYLIAPA